MCVLLRPCVTERPQEQHKARDLGLLVTLGGDRAGLESDSRCGWNWALSRVREALSVPNGVTISAVVCHSQAQRPRYATRLSAAGDVEGVVGGWRMQPGG